MTMPVLAGEDAWKEFLRLFVKCVRSKEEADFDEWRDFAYSFHEALERDGKPEAMWILPVLAIPSATGFFATIAKSELNPALPSFTVLLDQWGKTLGGRFEAVCDESKSLDEQRALLEALSDAQNPSVTAGHDRRTMNFPLPMTTLRFADSKQERQIQLADIVAGAFASGIRARAFGQLDGFESAMLEIVAEKELIAGGILPSKDVLPEDLGTNT